MSYLVAGQPLSFGPAEDGAFRPAGGFAVQPEFVALVLGLAVYTGCFIAEIVRSGILAVSKGQWEAAQALGLSRGRTLRLIVVPQALRVIIPPQTSQYLNLTKNSSLAVAIGYPDFFTIAGTINNQTGQAVEVVAITMGVYLTLSLIISLLHELVQRPHGAGGALGLWQPNPCPWPPPHRRAARADRLDAAQPVRNSPFDIALTLLVSGSSW